MKRPGLAIAGVAGALLSIYSPLSRTLFGSWDDEFLGAWLGLALAAYLACVHRNRSAAKALSLVAASVAAWFIAFQITFWTAAPFVNTAGGHPNPLVVAAILFGRLCWRGDRLDHDPLPVRRERLDGPENPCVQHRRRRARRDWISAWRRVVNHVGIRTEGSARHLANGRVALHGPGLALRRHGDCGRRRNAAAPTPACPGAREDLHRRSGAACRVAVYTETSDAIADPAERSCHCRISRQAAGAAGAAGGDCRRGRRRG